MLTIPAMVRVGPWVLVGLSKSVEGTHCERCGTAIKKIWTCAVSPAAADPLIRLGGKLEWRVGSECGPTLLKVSEQVWEEATAVTKRRVRLLLNVEKLSAQAAERNLELPPVILVRRELLLRGEGTDEQLSHLSLVVGTWTRRLNP